MRIRRDPRIDPSLIDAVLGEEVELLLRLVEAANASEGPLDAATVDAVLFDEDADCWPPVSPRSEIAEV